MKHRILEIQVVNAILEELGFASGQLKASDVSEREENGVGLSVKFSVNYQKSTSSLEVIGNFYFQNEKTDHAFGVLLELQDRRPHSLELFSHGDAHLPISLSGYTLREL